MDPEEILDDQNQDQEQEQGQEQEPNNSESEDITQAYSAKEWQSGNLISSKNLNDIENELEKLSKAYLAKLGVMQPPDVQMEEDGKEGYVPAPKLADIDKFLQGDGTWAYPPNDNDKVIQNEPINTNAEYSFLIGYNNIGNTSSYVETVNRTSSAITVNPSTGTIKATSFTGNGAQLTHISINNVEGMIPAEKLSGATTSTIGGVKVDGTTIQINNDVISVKDTYILPQVSSADAGKFLRVSDEGNWEAVEIINAAAAGELY